jgi:polysaccharide biosynthesis transport protein
MFEAPRQMRSAAVGAGDLGVGMAPMSQIDLGKIVASLWHGRFTILLSMLAALALAVAFITLTPPEYTAVTQILIDPTDLRAVGNDTQQQAQASDAAVMQVEIQVSVLTSDTVLSRVVASQDLEHDPEFVRGPSMLGGLLGRTATPGGATLAALNELKRRVKVKRAERTFVVEVSVTSRDPQKAARLANAVAQAYLDEQTKVRSDAARQVSQSLSSRLKELKDKVRDSEEKVEAFKASNNIVNANGQPVTEQQLAEINNQLGAARARRAEAKARLEQVETVQHHRNENGAFPEALQSPTITALRGQYAEVMRREAEQTASLGALHPAVIDIQAQADRLKHMIDDEVDRAAVTARTEYESAKASEQILIGNFETLKQAAMTTSASMVGLRELEREAQAGRSIYEAFLARARETGEQEQLDTKNIRVLTRADLPQRRSSPPPSLIIALGAMMFGGAAGAGLVLVRPPAAATTAGPRRRGFGKMLLPMLWPMGLGSASDVTVPVLAMLPEADVSFGLDAVDDPASPFAREMRKVYDELRAYHAAPGNPSVLIVSARDDDEAPLVTLTLAAVVAATQRVLVIDPDLGRRTLSAIDAEDTGGGLADVALGRRLLSDVTRLDGETNINLVPLVSPGSRRDRRIYDGDLQRAFEQTKRYDLVVVAAMSERDPSLRFFAGLVDHILLVARADTYDEALAGQFITRLGLDVQKIRGAVLTGAPVAS